ESSPANPPPEDHSNSHRHIAPLHGSPGAHFPTAPTPAPRANPESPPVDYIPSSCPPAREISPAHSAQPQSPTHRHPSALQFSPPKKTRYPTDTTDRRPTAFDPATR